MTPRRSTTNSSNVLDVVGRRLDDNELQAVFGSKKQRMDERTSPASTRDSSVKHGTTNTAASTSSVDYVEPTASSSVGSPYRLDAILPCEKLEDWLGKEGEKYKGLGVMRSQNWDHAQAAIDRLHQLQALGELEGVMEVVPILNPEKTTAGSDHLQNQQVRNKNGKNSRSLKRQSRDGQQHDHEEQKKQDQQKDEKMIIGTTNHNKKNHANLDEQDLKLRLISAASALLDPLCAIGLPEDLANQVRTDAVEIGAVVAKLVTNADSLILKLELMTDNVCARWHQDYYVCRAICTYNVSSTEYIHDAHVDFWELNNCGNNDSVVQDRTPICRIGVGNILFMKGHHFPTKPNGLVHRSPEPVRAATGGVKTRLVLKVDVDDEVAQRVLDRQRGFSS
ncbi:unnamed protein product [Amoebophrya sp. A120]|nr:unnamed protein product [Amoebophrya sp. A120]|eukprot:GSA120T00018434001.1